MTIISIQFSLSYRASVDKRFYLVQELKELPSWNEGFSISVFTGVSVLSFGLELRVDIVNHCWIEKNLRLLLLLILYAEEFIVTEVMLWSQKKNSVILTFKSKWWTYSKFERYKLSSRGASLRIYNNKYKRIGYQWKPSPTSPMVQIWVLICWEWSPTIAEIGDASGKRFVSDYPRRSEISTISSFR